MNYLAPRLVNLYIFVFCAAMIGIALFMQYSMLLEPCPLCIMQRVFFILTGLVALAAAVHNPGAVGRRRYGAAATLMALAGSGFALRQIYLQHLPADQVPQCLPSIGYMLETDFPLLDVAKVLFAGDGNCAEIAWVDPVIGLGIPQWAMIGFAMLVAASVYQIVRKNA